MPEQADFRSSRRPHCHHGALMLAPAVPTVVRSAAGQMEGGASTILYRSPPASTKSSRVELWANNRIWILSGCYNYIIYWNMAEGGFESSVPRKAPDTDAFKRR